MGATEWPQTKGLARPTLSGMPVPAGASGLCHAVWSPPTESDRPLGLPVTRTQARAGRGGESGRGLFKGASRLRLPVSLAEWAALRLWHWLPEASLKPGDLPPRTAAMTALSGAAAPPRSFSLPPGRAESPPGGPCAGHEPRRNWLEQHAGHGASLEILGNRAIHVILAR